MLPTTWLLKTIQFVQFGHMIRSKRCIMRWLERFKLRHLNSVLECSAVKMMQFIHFWRNIILPSDALFQKSLTRKDAVCAFHTFSGLLKMAHYEELCDFSGGYDEVVDAVILFL